LLVIKSIKNNQHLSIFEIFFIIFL